MSPYESEVKAGDAVTVTLPDGTTTPGVVSSVGAVATTYVRRGHAGRAPTTTIPVTVTLTDPKAAGTLDQAPVTVNITTEQRATRAGGAGDGAGGPGVGRVRGGGRRPGEHAALGAGERRGSSTTLTGWCR